MRSFGLAARSSPSAFNLRDGIASIARRRTVAICTLRSIGGATGPSYRDGTAPWLTPHCHPIVVAHTRSQLAQRDAAPSPEKSSSPTGGPAGSAAYYTRLRVPGAVGPAADARYRRAMATCVDDRHVYTSAARLPASHVGATLGAARVAVHRGGGGAWRQRKAGDRRAPAAQPGLAAAGAGHVVFAFSILTEAALSFLGAGVPPTNRRDMIASAQGCMQNAAWRILAPGLCIVRRALAAGGRATDCATHSIRGCAG